MKKLTLISLAVLISASGVLAGWWRTYGGSSGDRGHCVRQTTDGGYIVTGYSSPTPNNAEIWLIKLDSLGHEEWNKTYGEGSGNSVWQTPDGGYVIGGSKLIRTDENGETLWTRDWAGITQPTSDNGFIITAKKSDAVWLLKLNENGDSVWAKSYSKIGTYADLPSWVEQTTEGGYIITGLANDVDLELMLEKTALFLLKTDSDGNTQWLKTYGGDEWDELDRGRCVRQTDEGDYIVTGWLRSSYVLKTDSQGDSLWTRDYETGEGYCVQELSDGSFIIVGGTEKGTAAMKLQWGDLTLIKTDKNGDVIWKKDYGGDEIDAGRYGEQTSDSGYIVVGYTRSFGTGGEDVYLLKTDSLGLVAVSEEPMVEFSRNWEVVTSLGTQITLRYWDKPHGFNATVYDVTGEQVDMISSQLPSETLTWGEYFSSGVYFIKETTRSGVNTTTRVLIIR